MAAFEIHATMQYYVSKKIKHKPGILGVTIIRTHVCFNHAVKRVLDGQNVMTEFVDRCEFECEDCDEENNVKS